jgi:hypothetical protein
MRENWGRRESLAARECTAEQEIRNHLSKVEQTVNSHNETTCKRPVCESNRRDFDDFVTGLAEMAMVEEKQEYLLVPSVNASTLRPPVPDTLAGLGLQSVGGHYKGVRTPHPFHHRCNYQSIACLPRKHGDGVMGSHCVTLVLLWFSLR